MPIPITPGALPVNVAVPGAIPVAPAPVAGVAPARSPGFNQGGEVSEVAPEAVAPTPAVEGHAKGGVVGDTKPRYKGVIHKGR
jgi:hypothetical protein